jgi:tRNA1(Val) A37 N6-methylase TrmN6/GNAT superfamily N-acetyltransferase
MIPHHAISEDGLLGGRVRLRQPVRGYRAGLDAALLAASLDLRPGERALELGCGPGGALLQAAMRFPQAQLAGVERDAAALALAEQNVALNGLSERVQVRAGDVAAGARGLALSGFDAAFSNPPFFDDPTALRGPAPERRGAWLADDGLAVWTQCLLDAVKPGGRLTVVHRADRLGDLLALLSKSGGSLQVRGVHPSPGAEAKRVLVRAVKGGRAPLRLLAPLVLHDADGAVSAQTQAILQGAAAAPFEAVIPPERIKIRPYHIEDTAGLVGLFRRSVREAAAAHYSAAQRLAWAPDYIDQTAFAMRRTGKHTWVAEIGGVLAGFTDLEPDGHIDMLYVSADHQRRGVASVLYRAVEQMARGQGLSRLHVEASLVARPFFEAKGFQVLAEQSVPRGDQQLTNFRMEKRLDAPADA